jgi:hypothetical protein
MWKDFFISGGNNLQAYSEFRFYILSYMLYAEANEPEIYEGIMNNRAYLAALQAMDAHWVEWLNTYETQHQEKGSMLSMTHLYFGDYIYDYNLLTDEMRGEEYVRMEKILGMNPCPTLFE